MHMLHSHTFLQPYQRVLFCPTLKFSFPSTAFDINQRGCDATVMNGETYHTAQSDCMYVCVILNIPVINKAL